MRPAARGKLTIRRWAKGDWEWVCRIDGCLARYPAARLVLSSHLVALVTAERHVKEFHPRGSQR